MLNMMREKYFLVIGRILRAIHFYRIYKHGGEVIGNRILSFFLDVNECETLSPCHVDATCTNTPGNYACACKNGYTGNGFFCLDINECASQTACSNLVTCTNTLGSYNCGECPDGYQGNGTVCEGEWKRRLLRERFKDLHSSSFVICLCLSSFSLCFSSLISAMIYLFPVFICF